MDSSGIGRGLGGADDGDSEADGAAFTHDRANGRRLVAGGNEGERSFFHAKVGSLDGPKGVDVVEHGTDIMGRNFLHVERHDIGLARNEAQQIVAARGQ